MDSGFSGDMIFLAFLVLLLFGPRKLPEIVKIVWRFVAELKRASSELRTHFSPEIGELEPSQSAKTLSSLADNLSKSLEGFQNSGEREALETRR